MSRIALDPMLGRLAVEPMFALAAAGANSRGNSFDEQLAKAQASTQPPAVPPQSSPSQAPSPTPPREERADESHAPERNESREAAEAKTEEPSENNGETQPQPVEDEASAQAPVDVEQDDDREDDETDAAMAAAATGKNPQVQQEVKKSHENAKDAKNAGRTNHAETVEAAGKKKPELPGEATGKADKPTDATENQAANATEQADETAVKQTSVQTAEEAAAQTVEAVAPPVQEEQPEAKAAPANPDAAAAAAMPQVAKEFQSTHATSQVAAPAAAGGKPASVEPDAPATGKRTASRGANKQAAESETQAASEATSQPVASQDAAQTSSASSTPAAPVVAPVVEEARGERPASAAKTGEGEIGRTETVGARRQDSAARTEAARNQATTPGAEQADRVRFVQRVARAFEAAAERGGQMRIRLHPAELGAMRLDLTVRNGALTARLETESETARQMLVENLPALRERLSEHNLKVERFDIELAGQPSGGNSQQAGGHSAWREGRMPQGTPRGPIGDRHAAAAAPSPSPSPRTAGRFDVVI